MLEAPLKTGHSEKDAKDSWQKPIPLHVKTEEYPPYPVNCLPPLIETAVKNYQQYGQQPVPLIACSALASLSLGCQTLANIARDKFLIGPVSLYFMVVANSGERKTAADNVFSQAIREWEESIARELSHDIKTAQSRHKAWTATKDGLLKQIRMFALKGHNTDDLSEQFAEINIKEPKIPLTPRLFFEDTTQESMAAHLASGWGSASLWSDEAGIIFGGHGMQKSPTKFVAFLNRLWDGKAFTAHRKTSENFTLSHRRVTVNLMLQPLILSQLLKKNGGISRQSGFLARTLIACPKSAMGERFYQNPPEVLSGMAEFHQRITDCLNASLSLDQSGCKDLPVLHFSPPAKKTWIDFFNHVEQGIERPHQWGMIKDFASKAAENVARMAALFHLFENKTGDISTETVENAAEIVKWHLIEARRILGEQIQFSAKDESERVIEWLVEKDIRRTNPRHLQQYAPYMKDKKRRDEVINLLIENHYFKKEIQNRKVILHTNPLIFEKPVAF